MSDVHETARLQAEVERLEAQLAEVNCLKDRQADNLQSQLNEALAGWERDKQELERANKAARESEQRLAAYQVAVCQREVDEVLTKHNCAITPQVAVGIVPKGPVQSALKSVAE